MCNILKTYERRGIIRRLRSKIEANEYKDYILGFIFYKFLSEKELKYLKALGYADEDMDTVEESDVETVRNIQQNLGYFIAYKDLYSTWLRMGSDFSVDNVRTALSAFSRLINATHRKVFAGVFDTLQTGLSKLGESSKAQTKSISDLLQLINDIPMSGRQDYDVLGFIYEYLISNFAANAGKKAGEFYTPHEVAVLMSEIVAQHLKTRDAIQIYDPTSGSGSLLINIGRAIAKHMGDPNKIKYYAQELKENTYNLTRMNLVMRGILADNIIVRNGDTLEEDWPYFDENDPVGTYSPLYVDAVVSNPPYSQNWNPEGKDKDPRYMRFGIAPKSKADYAFLLHDLFHIKPDGIMTIVLPHGVLFRGGEEGKIRTGLIENNHIDAIIGLPANIFFGTGIPTIIMVLRQKRDRSDVLIVDASKGFEKVGKNNRLRACDIKRIADVVAARRSIDKFSRVVTREEIRANDYNLNIPRYVDSSEKPESWDIYASMVGGIPAAELAEFDAYWNALPGLKEALFSFKNAQYADCKVKDIKRAVLDHEAVRAFKAQYNDAFKGFDQYLKRELIDGIDRLNVSNEETRLSADIFKRLAPVPLVDGYEAFQILHDDWIRIEADLEILQTEGFNAAKQVDPNLVIKKVRGIDSEVQDGWRGHVLPFELVQRVMLAQELGELNALEDRLSEISAEYEEALDALPEDEKEKDFVNEDKTAFVWAEVKKAIKDRSADADVLAILKKASKANDEEKKLKKASKEAAAELHVHTKKAIEALTDAQAKDLLFEKWIVPLIASLAKLTDNLVAEFAAKLETLAAKYDTTLAEVDAQIAATQNALSAMIDDLTGDAFDMKGLAELKKLLGGN